MGLYDISFTWDDSILVDVDLELQKRLTLMNNGLASKEEVRMWYFGESRRQAKEALQKVQEESEEAIERNMVASSKMGQAINGSPQGKVPNNNQNDKNTSANEQNNPISSGNALNDVQKQVLSTKK